MSLCWVSATMRIRAGLRGAAASPLRASCSSSTCPYRLYNVALTSAHACLLRPSWRKACANVQLQPSCVGMVQQQLSRHGQPADCSVASKPKHSVPQSLDRQRSVATLSECGRCEATQVKTRVAAVLQRTSCCRMATSSHSWSRLCVWMMAGRSMSYRMVQRGSTRGATAPLSPRSLGKKC